MGSNAARSFVPRDVSSLMCDTQLPRYAPSAMPDWWRIGITSLARNTQEEDGATGWMWANDPVIDVQRAGFEVWRMTHLMVDAFKAWGRPPSNLISLQPVNNATDQQNLWWYIYSLLLLLHILCCDPSRGVLGVKVMSAMAVDWPPLDFNQESIREATWSCRSQTKAQRMVRKYRQWQKWLFPWFRKASLLRWHQTARTTWCL